MVVQGAAFLLMFVVVPIWIAAGLADYFCHRTTSIEKTSGTTESILHLLQYALVGLPVTAAMFFDINAGYFLFAGLCIVLHHGATAIDLVYAYPRRRIAPREQMVHSFLEMMPITALILLGVLYWPQLQALFGTGPERARFALQLRLAPVAYIAAALGTAFLFNLLPYLEELWRCIAASRKRATRD